MSFLSIFSTIGRGIEKVVGVGASVVATASAAAEPFVAALNPAAGAILDRVTKISATVESLITGAQQGIAKKQTATEIITAELPNVQELIASFGSGFTIPTLELSTLIDATVAEKNALAAFIAAVKPKAA